MFTELLSDADRAMLLVTTFTKRLQIWAQKNRGHAIPPSTVKAMLTNELRHHLYELYQRGILPDAKGTDVSRALEGLTVEVRNGEVTLFLQSVLSHLRLPVEKPTGCKFNLYDFEKAEVRQEASAGRFVDLGDEEK